MYKTNVGFENGDVEIRDYKTGTTANSEEKAKSRAQKSSQLTLYALAWKEINNELPNKLTLDFVDSGVSASVSKKDKSLETLRSKLADMETAIRTNNYKPVSDHRYCIHPL